MDSARLKELSHIKPRWAYISSFRLYLMNAIKYQRELFTTTLLW